MVPLRGTYRVAPKHDARIWGREESACLLGNQRRMQRGPRNMNDPNFNGSSGAYPALDYHRCRIKMAPSGTLTTVLKADHFRWPGVVGGGRWLAGLARLEELSTLGLNVLSSDRCQGRLGFCCFPQFTPTSISRAYEAVFERRIGSAEALVELLRALQFALGCFAPVESQTWLAELERKVSNPYLLQHMVLLFKIISPSMGSQSWIFSISLSLRIWSILNACHKECGSWPQGFFKHSISK